MIRFVTGQKRSCIDHFTGLADMAQNRIPKRPASPSMASVENPWQAQILVSLRVGELNACITIEYSIDKPLAYTLVSKVISQLNWLRSEKKNRKQQKQKTESMASWVHHEPEAKRSFNSLLLSICLFACAQERSGNTQKNPVLSKSHLTSSTPPPLPSTNTKKKKYCRKNRKHQKTIKQNRIKSGR